MLILGGEVYCRNRYVSMLILLGGDRGYNV